MILKRGYDSLEDLFLLLTFRIALLDLILQIEDPILVSLDFGSRFDDSSLADIMAGRDFIELFLNISHLPGSLFIEDISNLSIRPEDIVLAGSLDKLDREGILLIPAIVGYAFSRVRLSER